jgi:hypothetical protein
MNTPIAFASSGPLVWTQPKALGREYHLSSADELVGRLRFEKSFGSLATAEVASQHWTFKREGFLHPRVTVRAPNSDVNLAVFRPSWSGGGVLEFPDGRRIGWRHTSFWRSEWSFVEGEDRQLLLFKQHEGFLKISARLEFDPGAAAAPDLPMLAALGWYLMLLTAQDAAATVVTVAAIG